MLVNNPLIAEMVLRRVKDSYLVVLDVETSGLDWRTNHIIGHVVTVGPNPDDSFYVPVRHAGGGNIPSMVQVPSSSTNWNGSIHPWEVELIRAIKDKHLIFHNGAFDMRFLHRLGWKPTGPIGDTMIAAFVTDELRPSLSLDACCKAEGVQEKKGDLLYRAISAVTGHPADKSSMALLWQLPGDQEEVHDYASGDGTSTWQLWVALQKSITKPYYTSAAREYTLEKVAGVEMQLIPVLHNMSIRGMKIDEQQLENVIKITEDDYAKSLAKIGSMNVRSPKQVQDFMQAVGEVGWPLTEKGSPSFPEEWLLTTEPGRAIVAVRKNRTLLDSFLKPMQGRYLHNGRVYPEMHQTRDEEFGTRTGRMSITAPNLGAMPGKRQGELGKLFRSIFVPDEGKVYTEADYSNMEIRICAHYCKAKAWMDGFAAGLDPHTSVANQIGITRRHAKTINLALMTGSGKKAISLKLGMSIQEGTEIVDTYFRGLPELKEFQRVSTGYFDQRGFVSTLLGRRLQLADRSKAYTAVNRLTQGGNADVCKERLVAMSHVPEITPVLTVYDSVLFEHDEGSLMKGLALTTMADMTNIGLSVPMEVEYGTGKNWGAASFTTDGKVRWDPC